MITFYVGSIGKKTSFQGTQSWTGEKKNIIYLKKKGL